MSKLTKKQRAALDWLYSDGSVREWGGVMATQVLGHPSINTLRSLVTHGYARREHRPGEYFALTEAGRNALSQKDET